MQLRMGISPGDIPNRPVTYALTYKALHRGDGFLGGGNVHAGRGVSGRA